MRLRTAALGLAVGVALTGCAGKRIEEGVFHSPKGYRVALPGPAWAVVEDDRADLELRHRARPAGMLANATCGTAAIRRSLAVLARYPLFGLREREMVEEGNATLGGRPAAHLVLEGRMGGATERVRVELYVVKDDRCVYDFLYAAEPAVFAEGRADFRRFLDTFRSE